ncbi:quinolinate synthase NadA [Stygiobacter electus]|uniref:Quinolinate synthase n=1 Tax=Stygiobacter electus TaxID=3032292 RepID=A0AAE3P0L1_9BACT|nr:quinolinate synthase NadA [Stygiobacter electus]MDF1612192.1 quinolinate synthase NadA [Stygiobacter electus]
MLELIKEIEKLKKEKNAVILAHNYQPAEIQDLADYIGDSLGLSFEASKTEATLIFFCGVLFMAETASIISPNKKVVIPELEAGSSLSSKINLEQLREWKSNHPDSVVVSYVNTSAEVKSESDYCVTSSNAVKIVQSISKGEKILFLPDKFLGRYIEAATGRKMEIWNGSCHVHEKIGDIIFAKAQNLHPNTKFLIHPECGCSSSCLMKANIYFDCSNIHISSREEMINFVKNSNSNEFVIATEVGIIHRLKKIKPEAKIFPLSEKAVCEYMKMISLEKLRNALRDEVQEIRVPEETAVKAKLPIERMLALSD